MGVSSYFEFITTLMGWILYDNVWSVLADSGIVYIPFIVILLTNILKSKMAGDDEGSAGIQSLKKSEVDIVVAIIVLFLAAVPFTTVELSEMRYVRPTLDCRVQQTIAAGAPAVVVGTATGTSYDRTLASISGSSGRIPIWWGALHVITKSVISASIAAIPCTGDLAAVNLRLENDLIEDPRVATGVQAFIVDCYMPAKATFYRENPAAVSAAQRDSVNYLGSQYFLSTTGYYDRFYSSMPRAAWPFNPVRDAGFESDSALGGHPDCRSWWSDAGNGIRALTLASLDAETRDEYIYAGGNLIQRTSTNTLSTAEREDVLLRKYLAIRNAQVNVSGYFSNASVSYTPSESERSRRAWSEGAVSYFTNGLANSGRLFWQGASNAAAALGMAVSAPGHLAAGIAAREGSSVFVSLLLMVFVAVLPFLLVFSLYRVSTLMVLSIVFFGMHAFYYLWGIAFWVDNHLIDAVMSGPNGSGVFTALANPLQTTIIVWVQRFLYVIFPMIWLASLGWIGVKGATAFGSHVSNLSGQSSNAMNRGGDIASNSVRSVYKG